jgi:hypothetical protein
MSVEPLHDTRSTPLKPHNGGRRRGAGRPEKENHNPNWAEDLSSANQQRTRAHKRVVDYAQQQDQLVNAKGRSWTHHECTLLLTLILGIILHYGESPTEALRFVSSTIRRSYEQLHTLWSKWQQERLVYVVDPSNRGGGAVSHVDHAHHVTVDVIFTITEYIREANRTGGGCTSSDVQRCILAEHQLHISGRTLRNVLSSMGYRYGRGNLIGHMNLSIDQV